MGNTDSVPVISQLKSLTQWSFGDAQAARTTQNNFIFNNTFPVLSQITSLGYAIAGENGKALDLQKKFADDMQRIIDSIPVAGHIKGGVHYALGENEAGDDAMKAASRSSGVVAGGVGGFVAGGPVGAVAGGIAGGAAMDGIITGSEILINKDQAKPYGYVAAGKTIADVVEKKRNLTTEEGFDIAMLPVGDGIAGYTAGRTFGKPLGLDVGKTRPFPVPVRSGYKPLIAASELENSAIAGGRGGVGGVAAKVKPALGVVDDVVANERVPHNGNYLGLDKKALDNRANQMNPNHAPSGPGRPAGYQGQGTRADLNNHANQMNPNNPLYSSG
ncbi:DNA polymerase beta [Orchesella cincta]|uniref:DNA polymerase beta n=1 Tax=Orchesella cincta TaxID=48709 RepID=A0A1D2MW31_ORCCI|nr:DNA polymerase beta [Orchesella cincta]